MTDARIQTAERLLDEFAGRTGLDGSGDSSRRYLWTDAFAVMASLALHAKAGDQRHLDRACRLVDLVHGTLGQFRADDRRSGWISGLRKSEGADRPTAGGLRIGKPLPERAAGTPIEHALEWERDGQYFHYLTKWMHALDGLYVTTGDPRYLDWAVELARVAYAAFVHRDRPADPPRMSWKMSVDLTRPAVETMGHMDPLEGVVVFTQLRARRRAAGGPDAGLDEAIADMHALCAGMGGWAMTDPLGIGGLLCEACGLAELMAAGEPELPNLLGQLLGDAERSLFAYTTGRSYEAPPASRLAFRELGLAIGLHAVCPMCLVLRHHSDRFADRSRRLLALARALERFAPFAGRIEQAWLSPQAQITEAWKSHLDINTVMLAASLVHGAVPSPEIPEVSVRPVRVARGKTKEPTSWCRLN